jgi:F0F1-type ATP synthase assembly protein I
MTPEQDSWTKVGRVTAFGLTAGVSMLVCGWIGIRVDRLLGTTPLLTVVFFLGSGGSALWYGIVNILK